MSNRVLIEKDKLSANQIVRTNLHHEGNHNQGVPVCSSSADRGRLSAGGFFPQPSNEKGLFLKED
jgi:hypothetical protein